MYTGSPLYFEVDRPYSPDKSKGIDWHKGLWFERFFNGYDPQWTIDETQKKRFINEVVGSCGQPEALKAHSLQQAKLCQMLEGEAQIFKTTWHFATGMGNNHPTENGFSWHPTLGTPYLSGASVKGLVRAWVEQWSGFEEAECKKIAYDWFGSEDKDPQKQQQEAQTGHLVFFDALPVDKVQLHCDIMTPHGGQWYSKGADISTDTYADRLPADWHNPNIIPFLATKQASFQFMIAPTTRAFKHNPEKSKAQVKAALQALKLALEFLGAGAKTATGYGYFEKDNKANKTLKKALLREKRANLSPKEAFIDELKDPDLDSKALAKKFGSQFNSSKKAYCNEGVDWDDIIQILINHKSTLIHSWQDKGVKTTEGKAYKKLKKFLPQVKQATPLLFTLEEAKEKIKQSVENKNKTEKPQTWIVQDRFEPLCDFLCASFEEYSELEDSLVALLDAKSEEEQQKQLTRFEKKLKQTLNLHCKLKINK